MSLLTEVKERLRILDNDEDKLLENIIEQGKAELNALTGVELDYEGKGSARTLLLEYCRYVYNNATEYFEENFHKEIARLQLSVAVKKYGQEKEDEETI